VRLSVVRGGGLAGVTVETTLDTADLDAGDAGMLRKMVAGCFPGPPAARLPAARLPAQPDRFAYELRVETQGSVRTLRVGEADVSAELSELLTWVHRSPARKAVVRPPG